jgi:hypothetical protein
MANAPMVSAVPDLAALETRQQATWAFGDYVVIGTTLQIVEETLCEAVDLCSDERVLDLLAQFDRGGGPGLVVPSEYLEVVVRPAQRS